MSPRHRRQILQYLAACAAAPLLAPGATLAAGDRPVTQGIQRVNGQLFVNGVPAGPTTPIRPGDRIQTGPGSEAVFVVGDHAVLLRAETEVELAADGNMLKALRAIHGGMLSVFGPGPREISTPVATAGIRGTGVYVETDARSSYICVCYGKAVLAARDDPRVTETVTTTHHDAPRIIRRTAAGVEMLDAHEVRNHTDAELVMLEATVGRRPPFEKDTRGYSY